MSTTNMQEAKLLDDCIADAIKQCARSIGVAVAEGRRTCVHCIHFDANTEACLLAGQRPPARVIAFGCSSFEPGPPF